MPFMVSYPHKLQFDCKNKFTLLFQVGVNGYAFIVTNNGHVLIHPDLRPVFEDILKPAFNSVDMAELELMDDDREARQFDANLLEVSGNAN